MIDRGQKVAKLYQSDGVIVVKRTVYRIDKEGVIRFGQRGMPDPAEVLGSAAL